ncbi:MAG: hypothetical protein ACRDPF_19220 [Streptosporangiaceae bacterium]
MDTVVNGGRGREISDGPAVESGLAESGIRVRFCHPLVRSVAYWSAPAQERQLAHATLAEVADQQLDPDRRV